MAVLPKFFDCLFNKLLVSRICTKPYNRKRIFLIKRQEYPFSVVDVQL